MQQANAPEDGREEGARQGVPRRFPILSSQSSGGRFDVCSRETQDEAGHPASSHTGERAADGTPDRELRRPVRMYVCTDFRKRVWCVSVGTSNVFMYQPGPSRIRARRDEAREKKRKEKKNPLWENGPETRGSQS
ncbi:hypothetical protein MGYG_05475 [Nannizzia gypsea CBS 118893]|uniref:Uncharacterized protein n=1 Tax=Arthroderma gypseum (strain ATCC MYA-4604 / CBS 118893) TaxID=535722 RepID=E4UW34_ARTGP|nr:hypothetical protein MGYG_05475 [Nannizzia gypsea CBS 118893]EFR02482.1 hypothetical protein MGYG_05475 [Nannizzia gypsea CBS 118893]